MADASGNLTAFQPAGANASGSTTVADKSIIYAGMDNYNPIGGDATNRVVTGTIFDRNLVLAGTAPEQLAVSFENLSFTGGNSSFSFAYPSASLTLITGTGSDTIDTAAIPSAFTGTLLKYSGGMLTGTLTAGNDTAVVAKTGVSGDGGLVISLTINGLVQSFGSTRAGVKRLELDGRDGADTFTIDEVLLIDAVSINGGSGSDRFIGPMAGARWDVSAANTGSVADFTDSAANFISFGGIENLTGRGAADTFNVRAGGSISGQIDGGTGVDTLSGPDAANTWSLTGTGAGTLNGTAFVAFENLTGGAADDTFQLGASASLSGLLDGGLIDSATPSVNSLDYSQRGSAVSVDLHLGTAPGLTGGFTGLTGFVGSLLPGDTLIGPVATFDQTSWTVTAADAGTVDGTTFAGFENLTGQNANSDAFIFEASGSLRGTLTGGTGARRLCGCR